MHVLVHFCCFLGGLEHELGDDRRPAKFLVNVVARMTDLDGVGVDLGKAFEQRRVVIRHYITDSNLRSASLTFDSSSLAPS